MKRIKERAFLFMEDGQRVYRCQLTKDLTIIGQSDDNDIVIRDQSVESHHARITCANDVFTLRAIDDSEVHVDGQSLDSRLELENGHLIEIGDAQILFAREHSIAPTPVHLVVRQSGLAPMGFWSHRSTIVIGREKGDIILGDSLLSKVNTIIENFCPAGQYVIDARSERGTVLNGEVIQARRKLKDGDILVVGSTEIEFRSQPFEDKNIQDAVKLAAERIAALRAMDQQHTGGTEPAAVDSQRRDTYERRRSTPKEPAPGSTGQIERQRPPGSRKRRRSDRRGMDLRPGIQTGLGDGARQAASPPQRSHRRQSNSNDAMLPSESRPKRPQPTYQSEPHVGLSSSRRTGDSGDFGNRSELDTKLNLGDRGKDGLWYLPPKEGEALPEKPLEKPVIKARGDHVSDDAQASDVGSMQAQTQRPPSGVHSVNAILKPISVDEPSRYSPAPATNQHSEEVSHPKSSASPGARPTQNDRWYIPGERQKKRRQQQQSSDRPWYMPGADRDSGDKDEFDDAENNRKSSNIPGQGTMVIDSD